MTLTPGLTGSPLDRADHLRRDTAAVHGLRMHPGARWLLLDDLRPLSADGTLVWLKRYGLPETVSDAVLLGVTADGAPRFAVAGSAAGLPGAAADARGLLMRLPSGDGAIMAQARSLVDWHTRHGFCPQCGAPTLFERAGYMRRCTRDGSEHFPRTDPVVIMLAVREGHALVGRQPRFPPRFLSALAGFVEPGESLEEAVRRELHEEAGIVAGEVRYLTSQPWPFPSSLMLAAVADAQNAEITLDTEELEEARWVTREETRAALAGNGEWLAPPPMAIAHTLLRAWAEGSA